MSKMPKTIGLCLSVLLLLVLAGCSDPAGEQTVGVSAVTIEVGGNDITGLQYNLWEPADTDAENPKSVQLNAVVEPSNATNQTVSWSSSSTSIASVNSSGLVNAASPGNAVITAEADGKSATVTIVVNEAGVVIILVESVKILRGLDEMTGVHNLYIGSPINLTAEVLPEDATNTDVIWASSDTDVATITTAGVVTLLKQGVTDISVTTVSLTAGNSPATASFRINAWNNPGWTPPEGYLNSPLDMGDPVFFYGDHIYYKNERINLGDYSIFIDGSFTNAEITAFHNQGFIKVFNDFNALFETRGAARGQNTAWADHVKRDGTEANPFYVYLAPWVHWVEDPDDPTMYLSDVRGNFITMGTINYLRLIGLTEDFRNVVIASDRVQGNGAQGNTSMLSLSGAWHRYENISIGIYAPFDIEFPLDDFLPENLLATHTADGRWGVVPEGSPRGTAGKLGRYKRSPNSGQGGIGGGGNSGDFVAINCGFYARHNSAIPSSGNTMYYKCHIEVGMHGGSWGSNRIYLESSIGLWNMQNGGGAGAFVSLGSDIYLRGNLTDIYGFGDGWSGLGGGALIDTRIISDNPAKHLVWSMAAPQVARVYYHNVTYLIDNTYNPVSGGGGFRTLLTANTARGNPYQLHNHQLGTVAPRPDIAVDLTGTPALRAYKFEHGGQTWYNTYELFRGTGAASANYEPHFPIGVREAAIAAEAVNIPRSMTLAINTSGTDANAQSVPGENSLDTGADNDRVTLSYASAAVGTITAANARTALGDVTWSVVPGYAGNASAGTNVTAVLTGQGTPAVPADQFRVLPNNTVNVVPVNVLIEAKSAIGLVGTFVVTSWPIKEGVLGFRPGGDPAITLAGGKMTVTYDIGLTATSPENDWSITNWYRSDNDDGTGNRTLVWTTRPNSTTGVRQWIHYRLPSNVYPLQFDDIGKFITVEVTPGHSNSEAGTAADMKSFTHPTAIAAGDVVLNATLDYPTFDGFPAVNAYPGGSSPQGVATGAGGVGAKPLVTTRGHWLADVARPDEMVYSGRGHSSGTQATPWAWTNPMTTNAENRIPTISSRIVGARIMYTPPTRAGNYSDMEITWSVDHPKTGQVGGSALQWTEFMIAFDWENGTGYALRVERSNLPSNTVSQIGLVKYRGWSIQENFTGNDQSSAPANAPNPYTVPVFPPVATLGGNPAQGATGNTGLPIGVIHDLTQEPWVLTPLELYDVPPAGWNTMTQVELRRSWSVDDAIVDGKSAGGALRYQPAWWMSRPSIYFRTTTTFTIKIANGRISVDMHSFPGPEMLSAGVSYEEDTHTLNFEYVVPAEDIALINNHQGGLGVWTPMTSGAGAGSNDNSMYLRSLKVNWGN